MSILYYHRNDLYQCCVAQSTPKNTWFVFHFWENQNVALDRLSIWIWLLSTQVLLRCFLAFSLCLLLSYNIGKMVGHAGNAPAPHAPKARMLLQHL